MADYYIKNDAEDFPKKMEGYPWFMARMMTDNWSFGLLLVTGHLLLIENIIGLSIALDGEWLDVELWQEKHGEFVTAEMTERGYNVVTAPTTRTTVSINARHIVMAMELADT